MQMLNLKTKFHAKNARQKFDYFSLNNNNNLNCTKAFNKQTIRIIFISFVPLILHKKKRIFTDAEVGFVVTLFAFSNTMTVLIRLFGITFARLVVKL